MTAAARLPSPDKPEKRERKINLYAKYAPGLN